MRRILKGQITALILIVFALFFLSKPQSSFAQVSDWQKSASISPTYTTDFSSDSFRQSVLNLKNTHANYVTLIIPYYQSSNNSSDIFAGWNTPTDDSLINAVNFIHSQGMKVMFKIHIDSTNGEWRRYINPSDRDAWFRNYGNVLNHYADLAKQTGVEEYCLGSETYEVTSANANQDNTARWNDLIKNVRSRYSGLLTYSAQHSTPTEENEIQFWDKLDFIGLSAYFLLDPNNSNPTLDTLKNSWNDWNNQIIKPLSQKWNKPVLFTEVGYKSVAGAHSVPGLSSYWNNVDEAEQARDYEALFSYWNDQSFMKGVHWWNWSTNPNAGGSSDGDYTPQNKKAQTVMTNWFGNNQSGSTADPVNNNTNYQTSATVSSNNVLVSNNIDIAVHVKPEANVQDVLVDVEIYDRDNSKAFQKFFEHQTISANQTVDYNFNWSPPYSSRFTVKIGIFAANWSNLYKWDNGAVSFNADTQNISTPTPTPTSILSPSPTTAPVTPTPTTITPTPTTPPPTPTNPPQPQNVEIQTWWPVNNVTVGGNQPFKAMVASMPVDSYKMYWQVDGDRLNEMPNNSTDYPHKESLVDLSTWNWKGNGPYQINFVVRDNSNNTLSQSSINIFVNH
jgi:hypothetical protein